MIDDDGNDGKGRHAARPSASKRHRRDKRTTQPRNVFVNVQRMFREPMNGRRNWLAQRRTTSCLIGTLSQPAVAPYPGSRACTTLRGLERFVADH